MKNVILMKAINILYLSYLGHKFGVLICEDVWSLNTVQQLAQLNVESVLVLNASPYEVGKPQHRIETLKELAKQLHLNVVYINQVGGQDDLIFDGTSFVINHSGEVALQAPSFKEDLYFADYQIENKAYQVVEAAPALNTMAEIYQALVLANTRLCTTLWFPWCDFRTIRRYRLSFNPWQLQLMRLAQIKFKP